MKSLIMCEGLYSLFVFLVVLSDMCMVFSSIFNIMESVQEWSDCKIWIELGDDRDPH